LALGDLYRELGCCYIDTGDYERAAQMLTKALDSGLDDASAASAHYSLGTLLMRKQAHARALEEFGLAEKHAETAETSKAWKRELYKAMAVSFHELGMDDEAKRFYQLGLD